MKQKKGRERSEKGEELQLKVQEYKKRKVEKIREKKENSSK